MHEFPPYYRETLEQWTRREMSNEEDRREIEDRCLHYKYGGKKNPLYLIAKAHANSNHAIVKAGILGGNGRKAKAVLGGFLKFPFIFSGAVVCGTVGLPLFILVGVSASCPKAY